MLEDVSIVRVPFYRPFAVPSTEDVAADPRPT
jgi:hypothetical protein